MLILKSLLFSDPQPTVGREKAQMGDLHRVPPLRDGEPCRQRGGRTAGAQGSRIPGEHGPQTLTKQGL